MLRSITCWGILKVSAQDFGDEILLAECKNCSYQPQAETIPSKAPSR